MACYVIYLYRIDNKRFQLGIGCCLGSETGIRMCNRLCVSQGYLKLRTCKLLNIKCSESVTLSFGDLRIFTDFMCTEIGALLCIYSRLGRPSVQKPRLKSQAAKQLYCDFVSFSFTKV